MPPQTLIKLRREVEAQWSLVNPILRDGEPGWAADTRTLKIGDGVTAWDDLESVNVLGIRSQLNPADFGASAGRKVTDAAMTSGSAVVTSASGGFADASVGDLIVVRGVGASETIGAASAAVRKDVWGTIAVKTSATSVTASFTAQATVAGVVCHYGQDARTAIQAAVDAAKVMPVPGEVLITDMYLIGRCVDCLDADDVVVRGVGGAIRFGSANPNITNGMDPSGANFLTRARAGFLVRSTERFQIIGLNFEGDYASADINNNVGPAVYGMLGHDMKMLRCSLRWGSCIVYHDENLGENKLLLADCTSYGARAAVIPTSNTTISRCVFEHPSSDTSFYTGSPHGSTQAIYSFAGRDGIVVDSCQFINLKKWAYKGSGSTFKLRGHVFSNNIVWECGGGVQFGADDMQEHTGLIVSSNFFYNCSTNVSGWNMASTVEVLGTKGVTVSDNVFYWDRTNLFDHAGHQCILVASGAGSGSAPAELTSITDNMFVQLTQSDLAFVACITANFVGEWPAVSPGDGYPSVLRIAGNRARSMGGTYMINLLRCVRPIVEHNEAVRCVALMLMEGCHRPVVRFNRGVSLAVSGAHIRQLNCTFPTVHDNLGGGITEAIGIGDNAQGSTNVDYPLLGRTGRAVPTDNHGEVVFAYGNPGSWTDGDTVQLDASVYTYATTITNPATQFNSFATLVALLDAQAGFDAADYGASFSTPVMTRHIRVRRSASASDFDFVVTCARPTAGDVLKDNVDAQRPMAGATTTTYIWSPHVSEHATPVVVPDNAAAATLLAGAVPYRSLVKHGKCMRITHAAVAGGEELRWAVLS